MQPDTGVKTVDENLHVLFERALGDEPATPPGDLAREAMAEGSRLRRNRRLLTGGSAAAAVAALVTIIALNVTAPGGESVQVAAVPVPGATTACVAPASRSVTSVAIYLSDTITDEQRLIVQQTLSTAPAVRDFRYESREQAFEKFKDLWKDSPDFVKSVGPESLPESYRVELVKPAFYPAFVAQIKRLGGVQDIVGTSCPDGAVQQEGK